MVSERQTDRFRYAHAWHLFPAEQPPSRTRQPRSSRSLDSARYRSSIALAIARSCIPVLVQRRATTSCLVSDILNASNILHVRVSALRPPGFRIAFGYPIRRASYPPQSCQTPLPCFIVVVPLRNASRLLLAIDMLSERAMLVAPDMFFERAMLLVIDMSVFAYEWVLAHEMVLAFDLVLAFDVFAMTIAIDLSILRSSDASPTTPPLSLSSFFCPSSSFPFSLPWRGRFSQFQVKPTPSIRLTLLTDIIFRVQPRRPRTTSPSSTQPPSSITKRVPLSP